MLESSILSVCMEWSAIGKTGQTMDMCGEDLIRNGEEDLLSWQSPSAQASIRARKQIDLTTCTECSQSHHFSAKDKFELLQQQPQMPSFSTKLFDQECSKKLQIVRDCVHLEKEHNKKIQLF